LTLAAARERALGVLTPLELEIMQVLWDTGASTVSEVQDRLEGELAYTTVQTMLNVLVRKKKVRRARVGRAYAYEPALTREGAIRSTVTDLVTRMFRGSSEALLMALVDSRQVTPETLARVSKLLSDAETEGEGKP
jgi:BlaI family transcriptional regulator, penicillinase repressor